MQHVFMLIFRRSIAILLTLAGLLFGLQAATSEMYSETNLRDTLASNRQVDHNFRLVADAIAAFGREHHRLPDAHEFAALHPPQTIDSSATYNAFYREHHRLPDDRELTALGLTRFMQYTEISIAEPGFAECERDDGRFSRLRAPDYVLVTWRGEWNDCFAPTKGFSTVLLNARDFTTFGSVGRDQLIFGVAAALCLLAACLCWRRGLDGQSG